MLTNRNSTVKDAATAARTAARQCFVTRDCVTTVDDAVLRVQAALALARKGAA